MTEPYLRKSRPRLPLGPKPATIKSYADLVSSLAHIRVERGLSQLELDERTGLPSGYAGKQEAAVRSYGPLSLGLTLQALDVELVLRPRSKMENERDDVAA
jgi:hypothetical protein